MRWRMEPALLQEQCKPCSVLWKHHSSPCSGETYQIIIFVSQRMVCQHIRCLHSRCQHFNNQFVAIMKVRSQRWRCVCRLLCSDSPCFCLHQQWVSKWMLSICWLTLYKSTLLSWVIMSVLCPAYDVDHVKNHLQACCYLSAFMLSVWLSRAGSYFEGGIFIHGHISQTSGASWTVLPWPIPAWYRYWCGSSTSQDALWRLRYWLCLFLVKKSSALNRELVLTCTF